MKTKFVCYWWFVAWRCLSLGLHVNLRPLHIEVHLPFGFVRIGMYPDRPKPINWEDIRWRGFGWL